VLPSVTVTFGSTVVETPPPGVLDVGFSAPAVERDIVGEPTVTLSYQGFALPAQTFLYARVVDAATGLVAGNQVTPIPVVLNGFPHTVTRKLEIVALRGKPTSNLRLQLLTSTPLYGPQRSTGTVTLTSVTGSLPLVTP
jgi:ABC-2 type transport system ATP-binding protein